MSIVEWIKKNKVLAAAILAGLAASGVTIPQWVPAVLAALGQ